MNWKDIAGVVGKAAPLVGIALGAGPGATIGKLVANALGVENSPSAVSQALQTDPEAAIKLQKLETENEQHIREYAFKVLGAELADKQNTRKEHAGSKMPAVICVSLTILVAAGAGMLFTLDIPEANREIAYLLFGTLLAKWGDSIAYWVGTTRSSSVKNGWRK